MLMESAFYEKMFCSVSHLKNCWFGLHEKWDYIGHMWTKITFAQQLLV